MRIAAQLIAAAMGVPTTGAGGGGQGAPAGKGTVSERGGEINTARALDEQRATQGGTPRVEEMPTPEFAADSSGSTASLQPRTITEELFRQQNGGVGSVLSGSVDKLMAALTDDSSGTGGGGSGSTGGGSGGGGGSPQTRDVQVAVQFWRSSMDQLAARQGGELDEHEVALTIWDGRGNSLLWPSKRKRGVYYERASSTAGDGTDTGVRVRRSHRDGESPLRRQFRCHLLRGGNHALPSQKAWRSRSMLTTSSGSTS